MIVNVKTPLGWLSKFRAVAVGAAVLDVDINLTDWEKGGVVTKSNFGGRRVRA